MALRAVEDHQPITTLVTRLHEEAERARTDLQIAGLEAHAGPDLGGEGDGKEPPARFLGADLWRPLGELRHRQGLIGERDALLAIQLELDRGAHAAAIGRCREAQSEASQQGEPEPHHEPGGRSSIVMPRSALAMSERSTIVAAATPSVIAMVSLISWRVAPNLIAFLM